MSPLKGRTARHYEIKTNLQYERGANCHYEMRTDCHYEKGRGHHYKRKHITIKKSVQVSKILVKSTCPHCVREQIDTMKGKQALFKKGEYIDTEKKTARRYEMGTDRHFEKKIDLHSER